MARQLIIANTAEAFAPLIGKYRLPEDRTRRVTAEHRLGDRALLWGGDGKVVVTSFRAPILGNLIASGVYGDIVNLSPARPSPSLCEDILVDAELFQSVCRAIGSRRTELLSYVASETLYRLIDRLRAAGARLSLVETPAREAAEVGRMFDTKAGFRVMCQPWAASCPAIRLPDGRVCATPAEAADAAWAFLATGRRCVCKANRGESGIGLLWLSPGAERSAGAIADCIEADPAFAGDPIVVEAAIEAGGRLQGYDSPSVEVYVSPAGRVEITYCCVQLFDGIGAFDGVLIDQNLLPAALSSELGTATAFVGARLAELGYVGYFDVDFVVDRSFTPFMVEANCRRTGGTHAHDLAQHLFGPGYQQQTAVLSRNAVRLTRGTRRVNEMLHATADTLLEWPDRKEGVVPSVVSGLAAGTIGYVVMARSLERLRRLEVEFVAALEHGSR